MASSQNPTPTTSSSTNTLAGGKVPLSYNIKAATLRYRAKVQGLDPSGDYISLDGNVSLKLSGDVEISQGTDQSRCTYFFSRRGDVQFLDIKKATKPTDPVTVQIKCLKPPVSTFGEDQKAKDQPLAKVVGTFDLVELQFKFKDAKAQSPPAASDTNKLVGHLKVIMTGRETLNPEGKWNKVIAADQTALRLESIAQKEQLGLFNNCRIVTRPGRTGPGVLVEIYPGKPTTKEGRLEAQDYDFGSGKMAQSYVIRAPSIFPVPPVDNPYEPPKGGALAAFPVFGASSTDDWQLDIVDKEDSDAPVVGMITNSFGGHDTSSFTGREESKVALLPIHNDVLGDRGRASLFEAGLQVDEVEKWIREFIDHVSEDRKNLIGARDLFGGENCNDSTNTLSPPTIELPDELKDLLNPSQYEALETGLGRKVSIVWGPPGTGKSFVVAALVWFLLNFTKEQIVLTALANVAVDALMSSCLKFWKKFAKINGDEVPPFTRVYSEKQIEGQWQAGNFDLLEQEYHIEYQRSQRAEREPEAWSGYLAGREELKRYGLIRDEATYINYAKQAKLLNDMVLKTGPTRAAFCTITACRSKALYQAQGGEDDWTYPAKTLVIEEAGVPNRPQMMIPVITFRKVERLVMAGDPEQLIGLILDPRAKKIWPASYLRDVINRKYPCTFLNIQYRMHSALYDHLPSIIYGGKVIHSANTTGNPDKPFPLLQQLLAVMPLQVDIGAEEYILDGFLHFLDIDGSQQSDQSKSTYNLAEVIAASELVKRLLAVRIPRTSIAVMTGYRAQLRELEKESRRAGWSDIKKILTIDSSQGDEYPYVISSLVKTEGMAGFLGQRPRSNVGTSRQMGGKFFVGKWGYWQGNQYTGLRYMHRILRHMNENAQKHQKAPFVVRSQTYATHATARPDSSSPPTLSKGKAPDTAPSVPDSLPAKLALLEEQADEGRTQLKAKHDARRAAFAGEVKERWAALEDDDKAETEEFELDLEIARDELMQEAQDFGALSL